MTHVERVASLIADLHADAARIDSTPFTPAGIGETFGTLMATVALLAETVKVLAEREGV